MTEEKPKLKSISAKKVPFKSRGFLSQPSGLSASGSLAENTASSTAPSRARGTRNISATKDKRPAQVSAKSVIKPYSLGDE